MKLASFLPLKMISLKEMYMLFNSTGLKLGEIFGGVRSLPSVTS